MLCKELGCKTSLGNLLPNKYPAFSYQPKEETKYFLPGKEGRKAAAPLIAGCWNVEVLVVSCGQVGCEDVLSHKYEGWDST